MKEIIRTMEDVYYAESFIKSRDQLAYDVETTGLSPIKDEIIGFGISDADEGIYIVHKEFRDGELVEVLPKHTCQSILRRLIGKKLIMFNGSFDSRFTKHYFNVNLVDSIWSEAMLAKHTVDEEQPFRLKDIAVMIYGDEAGQEQQDLKDSIKDNGGSSKEFYKADTEIMAKYCIQDCKLTFKINEYYLNKIEEEGLAKFYFEDEVLPLYREVTIPMEDNGILLDMKLLEQTEKEICKDLDLLEDKIQELIKPDLSEFNKWYFNLHYPPRKTGAFAQALVEINGGFNLPRTKAGSYSLTSKNVATIDNEEIRQFFQGDGRLSKDMISKTQEHLVAQEEGKYMFNLMSKHHLKKLFFTTFAETPLTKTWKGNPQCNEDFLLSVKDKYEFVPLLLTYNKLQKIKGSYIDRFVRENIEGRFYPSFFQHRTISGRYGSDLQQLPRPKEDGEAEPLIIKYNNIIRKLFISGGDRRFVGCDYESLEPHVFAHVANDEGLKNIFRNGHDFYSTIAIATEGIEGVSADKEASNYLGALDKPKRQKAKAYCLGIPYGLGDFALSKTLDIPQREAKRLVDGYLSAYPQLHSWMEESSEQCLKHGFVRSEAGRVRRFPDIPKFYDKYGHVLLNDLTLWEKYHGNPRTYSKMKTIRRKVKNALNNSKNFQIQSLAASIVNRAAIQINRELKKQNIDALVIAQVHDELIINCPESKVEQVCHIVQDKMESTYKLDIELKAPPSVGSSFYEAK